MRKLLLGFIVLLCLPLHSIAQDSVGFSDSNNIQPLLDYRLPEWGYTNFFLDFSTNGNFRKNKSTINSATDTDNLFSGRLSPSYLHHYESESRISNYLIRPRIDYSFRNQNSYSEDENNRDDLELYFQWDFNEKLYLDNSDVFLIGGVSGFFNQQTQWNKEVTQSVVEYDQKDLNRVFNPTLSIGIGLGRLRTVNPVIQSLRLNERLQTLNTGQNLNQQEMVRAADQFTKLNGYQQTYDRPQKYFWGDMDERLSTNLSALDAFDLLYLTDVTSETVGLRQEGWQISTTVNLQYNVNYTHEENSATDGQSSQMLTSTLLSPTLGAIWYKNLSLKHQIGLSGSFTYHKQLDDTFVDNYNILNSSASWLYTITDRLLVNTTLAYFRLGRENNSTSRILLRSNFDYFVENSFSLFANVTYAYNWGSSQTYANGVLIEAIDERDIQFSAGLRYYFKRGIF